MTYLSWRKLSTKLLIKFWQTVKMDVVFMILTKISLIFDPKCFFNRVRKNQLFERIFQVGWYDTIRAQRTLRYDRTHHQGYAWPLPAAACTQNHSSELVHGGRSESSLVSSRSTKNCACGASPPLRPW